MDIQNSLSDFQFITSNIINIQVENRMYLTHPEKSLNKTFDVDYEISNIDESGDQRYACISLFFTITVTDEKSSEKFLDFSLAISGIFSAPLYIDNAEFVDTLELNGITALYGVARGHISALSSAITSIETINLPMINVRKLVNEKHKK